MNAWTGSNREIRIQEVALRDGLQGEVAFMPTDKKIDLINRLATTGLKKIEATSFVSPRAIPNLADAEAVFAGIVRRPGVVYTALVPNLRGMERAISAGVNEVNLVLSASESHNLANLGMTCQKSFSAIREAAALADQAGIRTTGSISCSFGCPMEGDIPEATIKEWCQRMIEEAGISSISLCDTTGMAFPAQVYDHVRRFRDQWPDIPLTLHFHNTRGLGMANVFAAIDGGATNFDAALAGIGGCPYAPGASGNMCTEDLVHALEVSGFACGINLDALIHISKELTHLLGHETPGQVAKSGNRLQLHPKP